jgi:DNA-binding IclR family transcriptional regulator
VPKKNRSSDIRNDIATAEPNITGSIAHAACILTCLSNDIHALTDIARQCSLGKSTVHRVLKLLEQSNLAVQDAANRRYYLGPLVTQLASNPVTTHEYLIMYASEEMKRLSQISEETITLDVLIGVQYFSLYEIPSQQDLKITQESRMGGSLYAGASIKALFSLLNDKQLKIALDSIEIVRATERTVTNKEQLQLQIKEIRQQGYTVSYGERNFGGMCISAPIPGYTLPIAMSIVGPEIRLQFRAKTVIEELKAGVSRISASISSSFMKGGRHGEMRKND